MLHANSVFTRPTKTPQFTGRPVVAGIAALAGTLLLGSLMFGATPASAATRSVRLGTAETFSVLAGSAFSNTNPTTLSGDLGLAPGTAITGQPTFVGGTTHNGDAAAVQAQVDLLAAYNDAAGRTPTSNITILSNGQTLTTGVYHSANDLNLTGTLTLDGRGDPNATFIFQVGLDFNTAATSHVNLTNGAQASHVFWQVGTSSTLGAASGFAGTIMALQSVTVGAGTSVNGRVLAHNAAVTLDNDTFTGVAPATK